MSSEKSAEKSAEKPGGMDRRSLLVGGAAGLVVGGGIVALATSSDDDDHDAAEDSDALATPAINQNKIEINMAMTWPLKFPGLGTGAERMADRITEITEGRVTVNVHGAGELFGAFECFDQVSDGGAAQAFHGASYYWQGKSKGFNFFAAVPFGMTAQELNAWVKYGGGQELWDELSAKFNLKSFLAGNTGVQMGGWFKKEINTVDDLRGLRMRIPGLGGSVINKLGGSSVTLPGGEIFQSLASNRIDATEWVGPWNDLAMGFYKIANYYYYPGFHEPGTALEFSMNLDVWEGLSAGDKALIEVATNAENDMMLAEFTAMNAGALDELIGTHGVELRQFSVDIYNAFAQGTQTVLAELESEGDTEEDQITKRIYTSFRDFLKDVSRWSGSSEQAYLNYRSETYDL